MTISRRTLIVATLGVIAAAHADQTTRIRLGTLAPRGTTWHHALLEMGQAWRDAQGGGASFTVYTDGSQGGEADMVRRMRVGQLNAALLSVVGLSEIDPSASALQKMPMVFRSWEELDHLREHLRPLLEQRFLDRGFVVLFWGDAGWVHFFSTEPATHPADYRPMRVFTWAGDNAQVDIMKSLGYRPVVLEISDILPALQTGMIDMVPSSPFYALIGQFYGKASYMLDLKWVPIVGAVVITRKAWEGLSVEGRHALRTAADLAAPKIRAISRREHDESIEAMRRRGLRVQPVTAEMEAQWRRVAEQAYPMIRGGMVPAEIFDEVQRLLAEYRAGDAQSTQ